MCGWKNGKRCRDGNPLKYCGVISTLFGCFLGIGTSFFFMFFCNFYTSINC